MKLIGNSEEHCTGEVDGRGQTLDDGDRVAGTLLDIDPISDFHEEVVIQLFCPVRNDATQHTPCQMDQGNMGTRNMIKYKDGPTAFLKEGRSKKDRPIRRQAKVEGAMSTTTTQDQGNSTNLEVANIEAANIETADIQAANIKAANIRSQVKVEGEMSLTTTNDNEDNHSNTVIDDKAQRYTPKQHVPIKDYISQTNSMERHALSLLTGLTAGGACERAYHLCPGRLTPLMAFGKLFRELQIESEVSGDGDDSGIEDWGPIKLIGHRLDGGRRTQRRCGHGDVGLFDSQSRGSRHFFTSDNNNIMKAWTRTFFYLEQFYL
ncbi:hypothetical protein Pcinc_008529 [Petrolisthes cinctipes]|uniref:Uncharacterized protein n=1 Tax=Petrolisthes cinctipes TaxID=88211 RepID=A0AAE1G6G0_PETCI|nr:hypothetical protein Pcinc_008529 [Petrolisthes cinctipes]